MDPNPGHTRAFEGTHAVGVAYLKDGVEQQVRVTKEVILSGGTIGSPQILLLSGVGPADQLQAFGIPVVADVPGVGHHLQDHLGIEAYFKAKSTFTQFATTPEGVAFVKTQPGLSEPDIELMFSPPPSLFKGIRQWLRRFHIADNSAKPRSRHTPLG
jgi:choline dehydrogenase